MLQRPVVATGHDEEPLRLAGRGEELLRHRVGDLLVAAGMHQEESRLRTERGRRVGEAHALEPALERLGLGAEALEVTGAQSPRQQLARRRA